MQPNSTTSQETVSSYLAADHDRLDGILIEVVKMVQDGEVERAEAHFRDFDEGLRRHIKIEEEMLFPAFEAAVGARGPIHVMLMEHQSILAHLGAMRGALDVGDGDGFMSEQRELLHVLGDHNLKEERVLYPMTDQRMPAAARDELVKRMRAV